MNEALTKVVEFGFEDLKLSKPLLIKKMMRPKHFYNDTVLAWKKIELTKGFQIILFLYFQNNC